MSAAKGRRRSSRPTRSANPCVDIAEVQTANRKSHLFVIIDCTSDLAFVQLAEEAYRVTDVAVLVAMVKAVP